MAYSKLTPTKLAEHFGITAPSMRRTLIESGLLDEYFNAPTAEGHLLAGAELHEGRGEYPSLFNVWDAERIENLFPALCKGAEERRFSSYPNRWKAASALGYAGDLLLQELGKNDPDACWLCFENFALICCDTAAARKRFALSTLEPLIERVKATKKKKRKGKRPNVILALKILDGVRLWSLGKTPKVKLEIDQFLNVEPQPVDRDAQEGSFAISQHERTLLESGYVIAPPYADMPLKCFAEKALVEILRGRETYSPDYAYLRMLDFDGYDVIIFRTLNKAETAYVDVAWHVEIGEDHRLKFISPCQDVPELHFDQMMHDTANRSPKLSRHIRQIKVECENLREEIDRLNSEKTSILSGLPTPKANSRPSFISMPNLP